MVFFCFQVAKSDVRPGGHIGFSASTPMGDTQISDQQQAHKLFDKVVIETLHVYNLDVTMPGEDAAEAVADSTSYDSHDGRAAMVIVLLYFSLEGC